MWRVCLFNKFRPKIILQKQIEKLENIKTTLNGELEKINEEITKVFEESQKKNN